MNVEVTPSPVDVHLEGFRIEGAPVEGYYFYASEESGPTNEEFLIMYLNYRKRFPLFITFIPWHDYEYIVDAFNDENLQYTLSYLPNEREVYTDGELIKYKEPVFEVLVQDENSLRLVLEKAIPLAQANQLLIISDSRNVTFSMGTIRYFFGEHDEYVPHIKMADKTSFFTPFHDLQGFYMFSTEDTLSDINKVIESLPPQVKVVVGEWE